MRARAISNAAEVTLWLVVAMLGVIGVIQVIEARAADHVARAFSISGKHIDADLGTTTNVVPGQVIARLQIPQINLSVPVLESYNPAALAKGVGHVPGTAMPGGLGNLVLVGHRDTYFRALRNIQPGMKVDVSSRLGSFRYTIDSTEIVTPDNVQVLDSGESPGMTLITCYPFEFIGSAPRRFIVHASLVNLDPRKIQ